MKLQKISWSQCLENRKIHFEIAVSCAEISVRNLKNKTSTLIFSANDELMTEKLMALEFSQCRL